MSATANDATMTVAAIGRWRCYSYEAESSGIEALPRKRILPRQHKWTDTFGRDSASSFQVFNHSALKETNQQKLDRALYKLSQQIKDFSKLETNWDSYGSKAPNHTAISEALKVLDIAHAAGMLPTRVDASVDEGIALSFIRDTRYTDIECYNSGEILAGIHDRAPQKRDERPRIWTLLDKNDIEAALGTIRAFIYG
jgi:hypothetical protein